MTISSHLTTFAGLPVMTYSEDAHPTDPAAVAWRISTSEWDDDGKVFRTELGRFLAEEWAPEVTALIIGSWGDPASDTPPIDVLAAAAERLTNLRAFFLGEMTFEECEISWIQQADITPLLHAYSRLEVLTVRGSEGLALTPLRHESLRSLTLESGGLRGRVVRAVGDCDLPNLSHLELWLGTLSYGGDANVEDLTAILSGGRLPSLTSLGLRDAEIADQVATALAAAPVVARLTELDLSMGLLTDAGGAALLAGQPLTHLRRLDLHHHFLTIGLMDRLHAEITAAGVELDLSDAGDPDDEDRYVEVAE